ncbi:Os12g0405250 [Oryza sativa Japonica Group]|uniref:Os12g0405250 protein n=1 Tax=Oryza sativa subsp. japonica TaxID=39947 RepID=C7J9X4_ORYSJ|nr:Os12g0405250 [Oryza sativa Japonica Group]|eukprot:NP_001176913.1 Os12g0405250 [Oryza sativa Japonica Group]
MARLSLSHNFARPTFTESVHDIKNAIEEANEHTKY